MPIGKLPPRHSDALRASATGHDVVRAWIRNVRIEKACAFGEIDLHDEHGNNPGSSNQ
jgi:hypothetical protein